MILEGDSPAAPCQCSLRSAPRSVAHCRPPARPNARAVHDSVAVAAVCASIKGENEMK